MALETPEKQSGVGKIALICAGVLAAIGYWQAENLAEWMTPQDPPKALKPLKKHPGDAPQAETDVERGPIEVGVGIDITRSAIKDQIEGRNGVKSSTIKALTELLDRDTFTIGDIVQICTFHENAECEDFKMPTAKDAMIQAIKDIEVAARGTRSPHNPGEGLDTWIANSLQQMLNDLDPKLSSVMIMWSDFLEEGLTETIEFPDMLKVLKMVVPDREYLRYAGSVKEQIDPDGNANIDIEHVKTGQELVDFLTQFTGELSEEARRKAKAEADRLYQEKLREWEEEVAEIEKLNEEIKRENADIVTANQERIDAIQERIESIKSNIRTIFATLLSLTILAGILGFCWINRPKLKGKIVDKTDQDFPKEKKLPKKQASCFRKIGPMGAKTKYKFKATGKGILLINTETGEETILKNGDKIGEGEQYYEEN